MATGARRAGLAHDPTWQSVPVIGCDGLPRHGQSLVSAGQLAATVVTPASSARAVHLVADWLEDRKLPPADVLLASHSFPPEETLTRS